MVSEHSAEIGRRLDRIDAQLAGLIGVAAASLEACPAPRRQRLRERIIEQLEHLAALVLADTGPHSDSAVEGVQTLRELLVAPEPVGSVLAGGQTSANDEGAWRRQA